jgi:hypothetical protein
MHIIEGRHRLSWYRTLQPFLFWSHPIAVPALSVLSSLDNLRPWRPWDLVVMVVISFIPKNTANYFIFNTSDVVSAKGAFDVGFLGNVYSCRFGGATFRTMVAGVLFLVPDRSSFF